MAEAYDLPTALSRWWRLRSRTGLVVEGALPSAAARDFVSALRSGAVLPMPMDAAGPEHADVVVIVGAVSTQLQPRVVGLRARLPPGAVVVAFSAADAVDNYAACGAERVLEVDVLVRGLPPSRATVARVVDAIVARVLKPRAAATPSRPLS